MDIYYLTQFLSFRNPRAAEVYHEFLVQLLGGMLVT